MHIKPFINLFEYGLTGGINRKILYILLFILLYQYIFIYKTMKLDQFLKWRNLVSSGGEAKIFIKSGSVKVNGEIETRRGRKLNRGDKVMFLKNELIFE
jgi:ribosome-associated protein